MTAFGKDPELRVGSGLDQGPGGGTKEELTELSRWERMRVIVDPLENGNPLQCICWEDPMDGGA